MAGNRGINNNSEGRLTARPGHSNVEKSFAAGIQHLELDVQRDALLYVPQDYRADKPVSLAVLFHGAGGNAESGLSLLEGFADESGMLLLAPSSRRHSWDIIAYDQYGPDINLLNQALEVVFANFNVHPERIAVGGFSDGASYALSVGLMNGDLFSYIIAFSPGFAAPAQRIGTPEIYISHGIEDAVLPINLCSRKIVPQLERQGYNLQYHEFDGPHVVPFDIRQEAVDWFLEDWE
ncbi:MAG TPA: alpha/beta hydrolase-fold protein [Chloroflexia bacterium]|nr:alpha/beta hydrolase-fold protein [Chloroflexia bacterium]